MWKISDFVSGLTDIRDTHTNFSTPNNSFSLFPFFARVFTGLFYFAPINVSALIGFVQFRRIVLRSGTWVILLALFLAISPSLLGVASNRYLYMFYTPFLVFSASIISQAVFIKTEQSL